MLGAAEESLAACTSPSLPQALRLKLSSRLMVVRLDILANASHSGVRLSRVMVPCGRPKRSVVVPNTAAFFRLQRRTSCVTRGVG